jgi:hypothetical protein
VPKVFRFFFNLIGVVEAFGCEEQTALVRFPTVIRANSKFLNGGDHLNLNLYVIIFDYVIGPQ